MTVHGEGGVPMPARVTISVNYKATTPTEEVIVACRNRELNDGYILWVLVGVKNFIGGILEAQRQYIIFLNLDVKFSEPPDLQRIELLQTSASLFVAGYGCC
jgi:hypothetical protein